MICSFLGYWKIFSNGFYVRLAGKLGQILMGRGSNNVFETEQMLMGKSTERGKCSILKILVV